MASATPTKATSAPPADKSIDDMTVDELRQLLRERMESIERRYTDLKAILDDPLQLLQRLKELELQRRGWIDDLEAKGNALNARLQLLEKKAGKSV